MRIGGLWFLGDDGSFSRIMQHRLNDQLTLILTELRQRLAALYGARLVEVVLFGSQARGEAGVGSDIDVMLVLRGEVWPGQEIERTGGIVAALSLKYDVLLSTVFVSEAEFRRGGSPLLVNVRREGIHV
jgi:predicted nucleotidyltransferase